MEIGQKRSKCVENGGNRSKTDEIGQKGRNLSKMVEIGRKWSKSIGIGLKRSKSVENGGNRSNRLKSVETVDGDLVTCTSTRYYICDMITRRWVMTLPESSYRVMTLPESSYEYAFGEGLVSRVEENVVIGYRVVRVILYRHPLGCLILQMFSSETGECVGYTLPCSTPIQLLKRGVGPICFNGILHWFIHDHGMVAFDPYKEPKSCRIIRLPDDIDTESVLKHDGAYRLCDGCQGTLRYFQVEPEARKLYCFSMWVMKDYEKGEWCCEFKVRRRDLHSSDAESSSWLLKATFLPLSFHPLDVNVVYLRCIELGRIVTYHVQDRRFDVASNVPVPRRFDLRPFEFQPLAGYSTIFELFCLIFIRLPEHTVFSRKLLVPKPTSLGDAFYLACVTEARLEDQSSPSLSGKAISTTSGSQTLKTITSRFVSPQQNNTKPHLLLTPLKVGANSDEEDDVEQATNASHKDAMESGDILILNSLPGTGFLGLSDWG
nr:hypothetical protein [Tanacetum cinerariifolium]